MPTVNNNAKDESENSLEDLSLQAIKGMLPFPVMVCGVNRKVNIGNFENIDVYSGIAIPLTDFPQDDLEVFKHAAAEAAELGFSIASKETGDRYAKIKEAQSNKGGKQ